jgi:hypothetical protein
VLHKLTKNLSSVLLLGALILTGCGGGGGGNGVSTGNTNGIPVAGNNVFGTAATGAAMAGGAFVVTKLDGSQVANGIVDNNGFYQLHLEPSLAPYIIAVTHGSNTFQSIILDTDLKAIGADGTVGSNINVTPLTDMITRIAVNQAGNNATNISVARTAAAEAVFQAISPLIGSFGVSTSALGLITGGFAPTVDAVDHLLDAISTSCTEKSCTIKLASSQAQSIAAASAPLVVDTSTVSAAASSAAMVSTALNKTEVKTAIANTAPVVLVVKAVSSWGSDSDSWAGYTGQILVYNFTNQSIDGGAKIQFDSSTLNAKGWWNVSTSSTNGSFDLQLPSWGNIAPMTSLGSNAAPYSIGFNGSGSSKITDGSNCKIGNLTCLVLYDDGSESINLTAAKGSMSAAQYATAVTEATHSWANFKVALPTGGDKIADATKAPIPPLGSGASTTAANGGTNASAGNAPAAGGQSSHASVTLSSTTQWDGGFNGSLSIANTSGVQWTSWRVSFTLPTGLNNMGSWGNYDQSQSGQTMTFSNRSWNGTVSSGGSTQTGFGGSGSMTSVAQASGALNCMISYNGGSSSPCVLTVVGGAGNTSTAAPVADVIATPEASKTVTTPVVQSTPVATSCSTTLPCEPNTVNGSVKADQSKRVFFGYYPSWSDNWFSSNDWAGNALSDDGVLVASKLARVPGTYTHISLSFAQPNFSWTAGQNTWTGSGLNFNASPRDIKRAIDVLHSRGIKVMLAVGGATYNEWAALAAEGSAGSGAKITALRAIQADLGLDGLEIDYEITGSASLKTEYANVIKAMRIAAGSNKLALAAWSTGADCTSETANAGVAACNGRTSFWGGSAGRERLVFEGNNPLVNPAQVDYINIMSYDAQTEHYDGVTAWKLYRDLFPSTTVVSIGLETAPEGWAGGMLVVNNVDAQCKGSTISADQFGSSNPGAYSVERYLAAVKTARANSNLRDGTMLWHVLKTANQTCGNSVVASPGAITDKVSNMFGLPLDKRYSWQ